MQRENIAKGRVKKGTSSSEQHKSLIETCSLSLGRSTSYHLPSRISESPTLSTIVCWLCETKEFVLKFVDLQIMKSHIWTWWERLSRDPELGNCYDWMTLLTLFPWAMLCLLHAQGKLIFKTKMADCGRLYSFQQIPIFYPQLWNLALPCCGSILSCLSDVWHGEESLGGNSVHF